jgi:Spy/CpxP family protein refolding chaperone
MKINRLALLSLMPIAFASCRLNTSPGDGVKVGQIVKLSKQGMFYKTYEAQIIRGGFQNGSGSNGQAFDFTVETEELAAKVRDAMDNQTEVMIGYRSEGVYSLTRSESSGDFLTSIRPLK